MLKYAYLLRTNQMLVPKDKLSLAQIGKGCAMLEKKIEVKFFGNTN